MLRTVIACIGVFALSNCSSVHVVPPTTSSTPDLILVGDSTMAPRTGYGDALCQILVTARSCSNLARGGRSSLSYRAEGL